MDYLKILAKQLSGKIKKQEISDAFFKVSSGRHLTVSNYKGYRLSLIEFGELLSVELRIRSMMELEVNQPNITFGFTIPLKLTGFSYPLFIQEEFSGEIFKVVPKAFWSSFQTLLRQLALQRDEKVIIHRNQICFGLHAEKVSTQVLEAIVFFLNTYPRVFKVDEPEDISPITVPAHLQPLVPYLARFAVADDAEREDLVDSMTKREKAKLIEIVRPLLGAINDHLDSFGSHPPDAAAIRLGDLANLVSELILDGDNGKHR